MHGDEGFRDTRQRFERAVVRLHPGAAGAGERRAANLGHGA
jgi:hypothetical protein